MTSDDTTRDENWQYGINREAALSYGKIGKNMNI